MGEEKGRGRPKKDPENLRSETIRIRATKDELEQLDRVAKSMKLSHSDVFRVLISEAENIINYRGNF